MNHLSLLPYGRLYDTVGAIASETTGMRLRVQSPVSRRGVAPPTVAVVFSSEIDGSFVERFRNLTTPAARLLVLDDAENADSLLLSMLAMRIRSARRFYIAAAPGGNRSPATWERLLRGLLHRLAAAADSRGPMILDASTAGGAIWVVSTGFERIEIPLSRIGNPAGGFELDDDGSYLHWPKSDLHLGWEQFGQASDPLALQRAKRRDRRFLVRYGAAIQAVRLALGLPSAGIPGICARQVRRIERGDCRLTASAAQRMARAHGLDANSYLHAVAAALD